MRAERMLGALALAWLLVAWLAGCAASTTFTFSPSPQAAVCSPETVSANGVVRWATRWRADQKDVRERDAAASAGIARFFGASGCFSGVQIIGVANPQDLPAQAGAVAAGPCLQVV